MPLVYEVSNPKAFAQRETVLLSERQHIFYGLVPLLISAGALVLGESLQGAGDDLFGRVVAARAEVPLNQLFAARIEMNVHAASGFSLSAGLNDAVCRRNIVARPPACFSRAAAGGDDNLAPERVAPPFTAAGR
jgi:hypothetical protein